jgi:hypothetical protein
MDLVKKFGVKNSLCDYHQGRKEVLDDVKKFIDKNAEVVFECTKCYERFNSNECEKHCKDKKHYSFRLLGTDLIRSFA